MKKATKLNLMLLLFLIFTFTSITFILQKSNQVQVIPAENNSQQKIPKTDKSQVDEKNSNETSEEIDLSPLIEKYYGKEISKINTEAKVISFTFDGGGNADGAEKILETLEENNIKATFFLTGKFIEKYPEVAKKISSGGHEVGNHSYSHPYFTKLSEEEMEKEISRNQELLRDLDIEQKPLLRLPYGDRNSSVLNFVSQSGYINIRWTIDSLGWQGAEGGMEVQKVQQRVVSKTTPGSIIMMHLGSDSNKINLDSEVLSQIIEELKNNGYNFLRLSELLEEEK